MFCGHEGDGGTRKSKSLPPVHFIHLFESQSVDEVAHAGGDNDGLIGSNLPQASTVKVIKVGVSNENEVDRGEVMVGKTCVTEASNHQEPICPIGIDKNIGLGGLNEKGGVTNPGDADLTFFQFWKYGGSAVAMPTLAGKEGW